MQVDIDEKTLIVAKEAIDQELLRRDSVLRKDMLRKSHIEIAECLGVESVWR